MPVLGSFILRQLLLGSTGGDSDIVLNVPSGSSHDFWLTTRTGITSLDAQADTDFDVKTSFDAPPPGDTAHGLIVGDSNILSTGRFLRWDVYNTGGGPTLFAADDLGSVFVNTALPSGHTWLRLSRTAGTFQPYSSPDGVTWTAHGGGIGAGMTVAQLGVWAGNFGTNPAHTVTFTPVEPA